MRHPIVAGRAAARDNTDVVKACTEPGHVRGMALVAGSGGLHMRVGFEREGPVAALNMAAFALTWRALELALQMAGFTFLSGMAACQREAGG